MKFIARGVAGFIVWTCTPLGAFFCTALFILLCVGYACAMYWILLLSMLQLYAGGAE